MLKMDLKEITKKFFSFFTSISNQKEKVAIFASQKTELT
jgi:hypothetical protein